MPRPSSSGYPDRVLTYLGIRVNAHLARMDQRGATAVEYALMVAAIAFVCIPVTVIFFKTLAAVFNAENDELCGSACSLSSN